jgi:DnaJ domain
VTHQLTVTEIRHLLHPPETASLVVMVTTSNWQRASHYELLGVTQDAELDLIKRSFRQLALRHHPDKLAQRRQPEGGVPAAAVEGLALMSSSYHEENSLINFEQIKEAYECLRDIDRRREYDEEYQSRKGSRHSKHHAMIYPGDCFLQRVNDSCEPCEEFVLVYRCQCGYDIDTSTAPTASSVVGNSEGYVANNVLIACPGCSLVYDTSKLWEKDESEEISGDRSFSVV